MCNVVAPRCRSSVLFRNRLVTWRHVATLCSIAAKRTLRLCNILAPRCSSVLFRDRLVTWRHVATLCSIATKRALRVCVMSWRHVAGLYFPGTDERRGATTLHQRKALFVETLHKCEALLVETLHERKALLVEVLHKDSDVAPRHWTNVRLF